GGGAISNAYAGSGAVTITSSTFTGNQSVSSSGGAIENAEEGTGTATITSSTFTDNQAAYYGAAVDNGDDGNGTMTIADSTFSGDVFDGSPSGASIYGYALASGANNSSSTTLLTLYGSTVAPAPGTGALVASAGCSLTTCFSAAASAGNVFAASCSNEGGNW